jgi:hypothetical protein
MQHMSQSEVSHMRTTSMLLAVVLLTCLVASGALAQDFLGPRLEGTVTLRSGQQISGVILTAQLGIVDGAEIGSRLRDGGYIAVKTETEERRVDATDIAAVDVEWSMTGTEDDPKWKITKLSVTTTDGEVISGQPAWLVHATSLIVELEDGTQKKIYAFPMAGSNFSPDNLMTAISLAPAAASAEDTEAPAADEGEAPAADEGEAPAADEGEAPAAGEGEEPAADEPAADQPVMEDQPAAEDQDDPAVTPVEQPAADDADAADQPAADGDAGEEVATVEPVDVGMGIGQPTVEGVPQGAVFATGQPAVVTFEVTNPATGEPMQVRFLIVPLPAE